MNSDRFSIHNAGRTDRARLRLGTALAGVLVVCAYAPAANAKPGEYCGAPVGGIVTCAGADSGYPDGLAYITNPPEPIDLTISFDPTTFVASTGVAALVATNLNGNLTINAGSNSFTAVGDSASGIFASTEVGNLTVHAGDVSTNGFQSNGIVTSTSRGTTTISAANVTTSGDESVGVSVINTKGDVVVDLANVSTSGAQSHGIEVSADSGNIAINAGTVIVSGPGSTGISTLNYDGDHNTIISVGDVQTFAAYSPGISAAAVGNVAVTANGVTTAGDFSPAIATLTIDGSNHVNVGDVRTFGASSVGIQAQSYYGDIALNVKNVGTNGADSSGVFAHSLTGDVTATVGRVVTSGPRSAGVIAYSNYGSANVSVDSVKTNRDFGTGIFVAGGTGAKLDAGNIVTSGYGATGVQIVAGSIYSSPTSSDYSLADAVLKVSSVETRGDAASGISATALGNVFVDAQKVKTSGDYSDGVAVSALLGRGSAKVGEVQTGGFGANAIYAGSYGGDLDISAGSLTTTGNSAQGIRARAIRGDTNIVISGAIQTGGRLSRGIFTTSASGNVSITNQGTITTTGDQAQGIRSNVLNGTANIAGGTVKTSGAGSIGIDVFAVGDFDAAAVISADSITTTGADAHGIRAQNPIDGVIGVSLPSGRSATVTDASPNRDIKIESRNITVSGNRAIGIVANGRENVWVDAGTTRSTTAAAIDVKARKLADVTIRGSTTGGSAGAVIVVGADANVQLLGGASINGLIDGLQVSALGPCDYIEDSQGVVTCPTPVPSTGLVKIKNSGTISGGSGYAVSVAAGTTSLINAGRVNGAVKFAGGDDTLINTGLFSATKDSDFGAGSDRLVNSGILMVRPGATQSGRLSLLGLERLENQGTIDLRNGVAGDTLALPGSYVGRDGLLGLDVSTGGIADRLTIAGAATGTTRIALHPLGGNATLLAKSVAVVTTGAGSAAGAFTLTDADAGLIRYGLTFDAASGIFAIDSHAGAPVYRLLKLQDTAQALWLQSGEAWASHMAEVRDAPSQGRHLWFQAAGGAETEKDAHATDVSGAKGAYDLGLRQDYHGGQVGYDLLNGQAAGLSAGITGGYTSSKIKFAAAPDRASVRAANVGGYVGGKWGPAFANILVQYNRYWISAASPTLGWSDKLKGGAFGSQGELGFRLGTGEMFVEPVVTLAWQRTDLGTLRALGQVIDFDEITGLRGKVGGRIGGVAKFGSARLTYYGGGNFVHEFGDQYGLRFVSGGQTQHVAIRPARDHGEGVLGISVGSGGRVSGFAEGKALLGGGRSGGGGRIGIRLGL